jgi:hypothetical protein
MKLAYLIAFAILIGGCNPYQGDASNESKAAPGFGAGNENDRPRPSLSYAGATGTSVVRSQAMSVTPTTLNALAGASVQNCEITAGGALPVGVTIDPSTCVISGMPSTLVNSTSFTVTVTNSLAQTASANVTLSVGEKWNDENNSASAGFGAATHVGTEWDTTNEYLRLSATTNNAELDESWTPKWENIVGYWKLDEAAGTTGVGTIMDSSPVTPAANGNPSPGLVLSEDGKIKTAANYDGTTSFINLGSPAKLNLSLAFTASFWIKTGTVAQSIPIRFNNNDNSGWQITFVNTGEIRFVSKNAGSAYSYSSPIVALFNNSWNHILMTVNGTDLKIFFNGRNISNHTIVSPALGSTYYYIGSHGGAKYVGLIDDVAIWNTNLDESEVLTIYNRQSAKYSGHITSRVFDAQDTNTWDGLKWLTTLPFGKELTGDSDSSGTITSDDSESDTDYSEVSDNGLNPSGLMNGLAGYWKLNEVSWNGTVGEVRDYSGLNNHGRRFNSAQTVDRGVLNRSGSFNGNNDYVEIPNSTSLENVYEDNYTLSAWYMPVVAPSGVGSHNTAVQGILYKQGNHSGIQYSPSLRFASDHWFSDGTVSTAQSTSTYPLGQFHHVLVSFNRSGGVQRLYVNGVLQSITNFTSNKVARNYGVNPFRIGIAAPGAPTWRWPANGLIDEVAIWNRALNADEVKELYRRGANRIKFQVRTCMTEDCTDNPTWLGPHGSNSPLTYFSEIHNNTSFSATGNPTGRVMPELPDLNFSWFTNLVVPGRQFFQYRAILESDDTSTSCDYGAGATWCSPELQSVTVKP